MKLIVGEDGAALFDENGRRVANLCLVSMMTYDEWTARDWEAGKARRFALARQFAQSGKVLEQRDELAGALRDLLAQRPGTMAHYEATEKARAALAKVKP